MTRLDLRSTSQSERAVASTTIEAAPETVFSVLSDPSAHAAIDGTGWVRQSLDDDRITAFGQVFRMAMHHENHPDKDYKMANRIEMFDEPRAIAWRPGTESPETGELRFGGWIWRYDLEAKGPSRTTVTLTYDWSAVPAPNPRVHPVPAVRAGPPRPLAAAPVRPRRHTLVNRTRAEHRDANKT